MPIFRTVTLSMAAVLVSAVSVQAATHAKKPAHHMAQHSMRHSGGSAASADNSADSLNAQSLSRAQAPTQ